MRILPLLVSALLLALPATAAADAFDDVFADYQKDGRINACSHSDDALRDARGQIPNDIEQYAPDFPDALDEALERRARGECQNGGNAGDGSPNAGGAPGTSGGTPAPGSTAPATTPAPTTPGAAPAPPGAAEATTAADDGAIVNAANSEADNGGDAPAPLLILAVVGGLLALVALLWGLLRWFAIEPGWLVSARHATEEAGWRTGGAWADFTDWVRRGRAA